MSRGHAELPYPEGLTFFLFCTGPFGEFLIFFLLGLSVNVEKEDEKEEPFEISNREES
jgi:hypothetical protein